MSLQMFRAALTPSTVDTLRSSLDQRVAKTETVSYKVVDRVALVLADRYRRSNAGAGRNH